MPPAGEVIQSSPLASQSFGIAPAPYGSAVAKSPAQLALERRLSGAAFSHVEAAGVLPGDASLPSTGVGQPDATSSGGLAGNAAAPPIVAAPGSAAAATPDAFARSADLSTVLRSSATATSSAQFLGTQRFLLAKGAFIDCTLETAIDSTLPGMTTCITATDTFGVDGNVVLLERGTKLIGETRGQVQQGTARVFVLWTEARTPTGVIVPLVSPGADELGRSGLAGEVDRHFWDRFGAAILISTLDGAVQTAAQSAGRGSGPVIYSPSTSEGVVTDLLKSTVNIPPTVTKRNGDRIQVLVARDLDFRSVYELRRVATSR